MNYVKVKIFAYLDDALKTEYGDDNLRVDLIQVSSKPDSYVVVVSQLKKVKKETIWVEVERYQKSSLSKAEEKFEEVVKQF